jgi:hypothetical protein
MSIRAIILLVSIVSSAALAPTARGAWWQEFGRSCGLGFSDGYHSRTGCPRRRSHGTYQPGEEPLYHHTPTGKIVPSGIEQGTWGMPTPAR